MNNKKILTGILMLAFFQPVPVYAYGPQGAVVSRGDVEMGAANARTRFSVDGTGVVVGVLSTTYSADAPASYIAGYVSTGDLPTNVSVLEDFSNSLDFTPVKSQAPGNFQDEGRGMLELVHDMSPGATLMFHTSGLGEADYAAGIRALADSGANVIVDDTTYITEPVWQDGGLIGDAVNYAMNKGVIYVSAAGNFGRVRYEAPFNNSGITRTINGKAEQLHNFNTSGSVNTCMQITVESDGYAELFSLHWNQPYRSIGNGPGASSDLDIFLMDKNCQAVLVRPTNIPGTPTAYTMGAANNLGGDSVETIAALLSDSPLTAGTPDYQTTTATYGIAIGLAAGPAPSLMRISFGSGAGGRQKSTPDNIVAEAETPLVTPASQENFGMSTNGPSLFGHANLPGVIAVGAVRAQMRHVYGYSPVPDAGGNILYAFLETSNKPTEIFSSFGGTPLLFDSNGNALAQPMTRSKPDLAGEDGVENRTVGREWSGFYSASTGTGVQAGTFYGTAASAAQVAGIAALIKQAVPSATPAQVATALRVSASAMDDSLAPTGTPGFNYATGNGLVQGDSAVIALEAGCVFDWAEKNYANLFAPAGAQMKQGSGAAYRSYPGTNSALTISFSNSHVYYQGPSGQSQDEGPLANWLPLASCKVISNKEYT